MAGPEDLERRVAELEASLALAREQLRNVVRLLPPESLVLLPEALACRVEEAPPWSPTSGWVESVELCPADVVEELDALWRRTSPKGS